MPAYNEEGSVARVIDEIRAFDSGFEVIVVDDGSGDRTTEVAEEKGARVLTLPYNLGIGGSVQTAFRYAWRTTSSSPCASTGTASTTRLTCPR